MPIMAFSSTARVHHLSTLFPCLLQVILSSSLLPSLAKRSSYVEHIREFFFEKVLQWTQSDLSLLTSKTEDGRRACLIMYMAYVAPLPHNTGLRPQFTPSDSLPNSSIMLKLLSKDHCTGCYLDFLVRCPHDHVVIQHLGYEERFEPNGKELVRGKVDHPFALGVSFNLI